MDVLLFTHVLLPIDSFEMSDHSINVLAWLIVCMVLLVVWCVHENRD
jgi:hypothetical protein